MVTTDVAVDQQHLLHAIEELGRQIEALTIDGVGLRMKTIIKKSIS